MELNNLTEEILEKLRDIKGFPVAKDEDIIKISKPPYYTVCPNPWIKEFLDEIGRKSNKKVNEYLVKPYSLDVSEGKNHPIYKIHTYHTKVPHRAIMRYILHYTKPWDIVYDGFAGTGMTGVASSMCGRINEVKEIGYTIREKGDIYKDNKKISEIGPRYSILNDISPIATFIAYNLNHPDKNSFLEEAKNIVSEVEEKYRWMYKTKHIIKGKEIFKTDISSGKKVPIYGKVDYFVWSEVFICPNCLREIIFWECAFDKDNKKVNLEFECCYCNAKLKKGKINRAFETKFDEYLNRKIRQAKMEPVLVRYRIIDPNNNKSKQFEKVPDEGDRKIIQKIEKMKIPYWFPTNKMMHRGGSKWGKMWRKYHEGITHIHHFYTKRNLWILSALFSKLKSKHILQFLFNSISINLTSKLTRYRMGKNGQLSGTLYIPSLIAEANVFNTIKRKIDSFHKGFENIIPNSNSYISCCSSDNVNFISDDAIDFIFTDPPFGGNIIYSELNFIWESWLKVFTSDKSEAIINKFKKKGIIEYQSLMEKCFSENYRILKPNHWMIVEFHNSKNSIWNCIQEAIQKAGFIIADIRILDKQQGTNKQITTSSAVKKDLIISAYKPSVTFHKKFFTLVNSEKSVWEFVSEHLNHLSVVIENNQEIEVNLERQKYLLFDRMVAFFIQNGKRVPISSGDFYKGLDERFPERDGMYFLPHQISEYERKRMKSKGIQQLQLFISDEKSAILWLKRELNKPMRYHEIQPKFLQQMLSIEKYEEMPELMKILEENFLKEEGDLWYVPNPNKEADLEKIRNKHLLKEFNGYFNKNLKPIKKFRMEAIRAGFKDAWENNNYSIIVEFANRIPSTIIQEDSALLMYYDNALLMVPNQR